MIQLHKRFTDTQVKNLLKRYVMGEIERKYVEEILDIKRRRFCELVKIYSTSGKHTWIKPQGILPSV